MISISKYDVIVVKFPFASSLKYKARPAVVLSSDIYNGNKRDTLIICAISSQIESKLDFEVQIQDWQRAGLLKSSLFKSSIATIEKDYLITKLGSLSKEDRDRLDTMIDNIC